jgi:bifunctional UDP-N-acetylglucosamine pyrophosphorylase/glucosamine-1-phosphate N-acetyltransferase
LSVCAVVPAAGRGSRLGLDLPKLLVSITENDTIWSLLRSRLEGLVDRIHVILSPADVEAFQQVLKKGPEGTPVSIGVQTEPIGMGHAVFCGHSVWSQADIVLVVWGDQVHVSRHTLKSGLALHERAERHIVLPLVSLPDPYVEYVFDGTGNLAAVRQSREGDCCQLGGLGDVGTFLLSTEGLRDEWSLYLRTNREGAATAEVNFLPFLVFLAQRNWEVKQLSVTDPLEARGINTPIDLDFFRSLYVTRTRRRALP